ncbi:MAG: response regulator [Acidobacteriota bacterium]|nr:response regulator [Acidobacteriota bacterium]
MDKSEPVSWSLMEPPDRATAEAAGSLLLLAEDHPTNRLVLTKQLAMAGYRADAVEDGLAALEALGRTAYGLVLTDIQMPRMDGYQLAREIRKIEQARGRARIPVLAITANALKGELELCLEAGMDDCIIKPVSIPDLDAKLRRWLPAAQGLMGAPAEEPPRPEPRRETPAVEAPLNLGHLETLCQGDRSHAMEILRDFRDATNFDMAGLAAALSRQDLPDLARCAHRIKGSSFLVGARPLADAALALEQSARTGRTPDLESLVAALQAAFLRLENFLDERMEDSQQG